MLKIQNAFLVLIMVLIFSSCKQTHENSQDDPSPIGKKSEINHAKGFEIEIFEDYKVITIKNAWPGTDKIFKYALAGNKASVPNLESYDAVLKTPVKRIVVTSTTHIPSMEMLGELDALIGFPGLNFISSEKTREKISNNEIQELGQNEDLNTEIIIDLSPDAVVGFAMDGNNPSFSTLQKTGTPVLYNADWTETTPLGKAEWIKFFGALFDKDKVADSIFKNIELEYLSAKEIASKAKNIPTVISGAMYKDVWYMPQGESWGAQFIADANGEYLWKDFKGTGSLSLSLESVLEKGHDAEIWIGPGQFIDMESMRDASKAYAQFDAFKTGNVYSYNLKKGATGGTIYFELAPNRPDLVLKDLIRIFHPELLPNHEPYFFHNLK